MTQIEMETMTAIKNYCRQNTPGRKTVRLALASEFAQTIIAKETLDETEEGYVQKVVTRARILADALMAECEKGGEA